ncbi:MAG: helix-hairpin-helix domain-containing protein [Clostridiales Family XIII bacterium]|jgi:competence protein ComEA|nr:helix-hairpin-helix domain-containing protein [Clostridiales Family XIII bacterium]
MIGYLEATMSHTIQTFFSAMIEDPKRRKQALVSAVVILVVMIGLARYASQTDPGVGAIVRGDTASGVGQAADQSPDTQGLAAADETSAIQGDTASDSAGSSVDINPLTVGEDGGGPPPAAVFIDVGGAVVRPGVIALPPGSRITDAIEAAGGLTEAADVSVINRAQVVADGDKLYIPTAKEVENGQLKPSVGLVIGEGGFSGAAAGGSAAAPETVSSAGNAPGTDAQSRINLNTADAETLQLLNGVGPATAQKIIDYRSAHGQFKRIEDIMNVSGIGTKTYEKLKDKICV